MPSSFDARGSASGLPSFGRRPRILCVDDEEPVLRAMCRVLGARFDVTAVTGAREALQLAQSAAEPFAIVIADLLMPDLSGVGLFQCMRQLAPDTVRVLISGNADMGSAAAAVNAGEIFRFLTKPFDPETLTRAVSDACAQHERLVRVTVAQPARIRGHVRTLNAMLAAARPLAHACAERIERRVCEVADCCEIAGRGHLEAAAALSQIGSVALPADVADRIYGSQPLTEADAEHADRVLGLSATLLNGVPELAPVRALLLACAAGADDAGPHDVNVIGAAILGAALRADEHARQGRGIPAPELAHLSDTVDPVTVGQIRALLTRDDAHARIRCVRLGDADPGMIVTADVFTPQGLLFIARGQVITEGLVARLLLSWGPSMRNQLVTVRAPRGEAAQADSAELAH